MMTLLCTKCNAKKPEDEFRWRSKAKGERQCWCKLCFSLHEKAVWKRDPDRRKRNTASNAVRRRRNVQFVWDYLCSHPCIECGEGDPIVLEFDHREQDTKCGDISNMAGGSLGIDTLVEEIKKCDVLCANCHRRRTAKQQNWYKGIVR